MWAGNLYLGPFEITERICESVIIFTSLKQHVGGGGGAGVADAGVGGELGGEGIAAHFFMSIISKLF